MALLHAQPTAVTEPCAADASPRLNERRADPRIELHVGVGFRCAATFHTGFTADISERGLFVATHAIQPIGSTLTLTFALPSGPEITAQASVRWLRDSYHYDPCSPPGMGLLFTDLPDEARARIRELITARQPRFFAS